MGDVLGSPAGRGGRRGTVVAAVSVAAAVVLAGALVAVRRDESPRTDAALEASPTGAPSEPPSEPSPSEPSPSELVTSPPGGYPDLGPRRVKAPAWSGPHDPLLVVRDGTVFRVRPGADEPEEIGPAGGARPIMVPVTGGTVVSASRGDDTDKPGPVTFVGSGARTPVALGTATGAARALDPGTVWLWDATESSSEPRFAARRVDVRTGRVRQRVTLPPGTKVLAEVETGLVVGPADRLSKAADSVWDPRTSAYVRRFDGHVWASTSRVALVIRTDCFADCDTVVDVVAGTTRKVRDLDAGMHDPVLSPDGRWLAGFEGEKDAPLRLVVQDLKTGAVTTLRDSELVAYAFTFGVWSRDSRTLYMWTVVDDGGQVVAWRTGTDGVRTMLDGRFGTVAAE